MFPGPVAETVNENNVAPPVGAFTTIPDAVEPVVLMSAIVKDAMVTASLKTTSKVTGLEEVGSV